MPRSESSLTPEKLLMDFPPEVVELAGALRRLVKETVPLAKEKAYPIWRGIGYTHPQSGYFCAIFPHAELVDLAFEFGVLLTDPDGLLEGEGKQVRYLHLRPGKVLPEAAVRDLILEAVSLPGNRAVKLAMIQTGARRVD